MIQKSGTFLWLVGWLEFNIPFQHKYSYIRDEHVFMVHHI